MKKIYLFSTLLCAGLSLSAQQVVHNDIQLKNVQMEKVQLKAKTCADIFNTQDFVPRFSNQVKRVSGAPMVDSLSVFTTPNGVYSQILMDDDNSGMFASLPFDMWYLPALTDTYWYAWSTEDPDATEFEFSFIDVTGESDDEPLEIDENGRGKLRLFGSYLGRSVKIKGSIDGVTDEWDRSELLPEPKPEWIAQGITESYPAFMTPIATAVENGTVVESVGLSQAAYGNLWGYYGGYTDGAYWGDGGQPSLDVTALVQKFTPSASPLYIFGGTIICSSADDVSPINPENVTVEIWTLEDDQLSEPLAVAKNNKVYGTTTGGIFGDMKYVFQDETGVFPVPAPVTIPAGVEFAVVINNIKGSNLCVGFTQDYTNGNVGWGGAYYFVDDQIYYTNPEDTRSVYDLAIGIDAYMPVAQFNASYLAAPEDGGAVSGYDGDLEKGSIFSENIVTVASTHPYVDAYGEQQMTITAPEWITSLQADTTGYSSTANFALYMEAEPLPDGMDNRHGWVTISMYGFEKGIRIGQGTGWSGVETTVAEAEVSANVVAGDFVLTYGEGVDKVDVYNVAGSLVASYALPANGYFTVPASDLAKGLYVLNFTGEKKAAVKVVK